MTKLKRAAASAAPVAIPLLGTCAVAAAAYYFSADFRFAVDRLRLIINRYPLACAMVSSGVTLGFLPDLFAQRYEGAPFNWQRSAGMIVLGALVGGIVVRKFYDLQAWLFPGGGIGNTVKQVLVDQFGYTPIYLPCYLVSVNAIVGKRGADLVKGVWGKMKMILPLNWLYWGLMALPVLYNLPQDLKVYALQFFSILWLSFQAKKACEPV